MAMEWQRLNLIYFFLLIKIFCAHFEKGNKPSMTFAISDTKDAAQLLTLYYQSKIVHHGNVALKRKVTVKHLICSWRYCL